MTQRLSSQDLSKLSSLPWYQQAMAEAYQTAKSRLMAGSALPTPKTDIELKAFVKEMFGVSVPDVQICPNHSTPWRAFSDAYFARSGTSVWEASRGFGGKTFLLALLGLTEALTLGCDVNILGGSGEQSARVHAHMIRLWESPNAPKRFMVRDPSVTRTRLTTGCQIIALTASQRSVRGPHVARLRLDEVDEMDLKILDAAAGQPMDQNGVRAQTVLSSTHQNADGTFTEVLKRAEEREWHVHRWCYRESMKTESNPEGWLEPDEVERKKADVTAVMWDNEYELQAPNPEDRAIDPERSVLMFKDELGIFKGRDKEYIEIEAPVTDGKYSTGADWARKKDYTVIVTQRIDVRPVRVIAYEMLNRRPWPDMVQRFDDRLERYHKRGPSGWKGQAFYDETGIGDVVGGYIRHDAVGVIMVGRDRSDMLSDYIKAIEGQEIVSPNINSMANQHIFASVDDVYGNGHLPDSMSAGALAWIASGPRRGWGR